MSSPLKLSNNAIGRLAGNISNSATAINLQTGQGALFPTLGVGDFFNATIVRASDSAIEIVKVTARSSDALTVVRAQETTSGISFLAGDRIELRMTAGTFTDEISRVEAKADAALPKAGGVMTGNLEMGASTKIIFEGASADAFETTLQVTDPTADRTVTLQDADGTLALLTDLDPFFKTDGSRPMTGLLTFKEGTPIAAAANTNLSTATGNTVHITGLTPIAAWTMTDGQVMDVIFDAATPLTYHATNNKITGGESITAEVGDCARLFYDGTTVIYENYTRSNVSLARPLPIRVRQSIQYGPTTGTPAVSDLIPQSQVGATLATGVTAKFSTKATLLSIANGFNADGSDNNINVILNADLTLTNLTNNATNVIAYDKTNNVLVKTTVLDTDTKGGTPAVTSGLYTLDYENWKMYLGDGTAANQVQHIIIAEVDTNATVVTAIRCAAYKAEYLSPTTALPAGSTPQYFIHNVRASPEMLDWVCTGVCTSAIAGFSVGDRTQGLSSFNSIPASVEVRNFIDRKSCAIQGQANSGFVIPNKSTATVTVVSGATFGTIQSVKRRY